MSSSAFTYTYQEGILNVEATATVAVTNTTPIIGGDDAETAEEIRTEAPNVFKTGDRLVTKDDFKAILLNTPSIAEVSVWGENEENPSNSNYNMFNRVKICVLQEGWNHPSEAFVRELGTMLYQKSLMTVKYEFITAEILNLVPVLDVYVVRGYGLSTTQAAITNLLQNEFVLGQTVHLGQPVYESNIIQKIDDLDSVGYLHMTLMLHKALTASSDSGTNFVAALESSSIKQGGIEIYTGTTKIAVDVPDVESTNMGTFVSTTPDYTVEGTVDYGTGEVDIDITPADSNNTPTPYALYQQDNNGDILVDLGQICRLHSVSTNSIQYQVS